MRRAGTTDPDRNTSHQAHTDSKLLNIHQAARKQQYCGYREIELHRRSNKEKLFLGTGSSVTFFPRSLELQGHEKFLQLQNKSAAESWWNTGSVTLAFWYHRQLSSIIDTPAPVPACRAAARASRICHCHFASARHCSGNCMCKAKLSAPDSATAAGLGGCSTPKQRFYVSYYVPQQEP